MRICFVTNRNIVRNANMKRAFGMSKYLLLRGHQPAVVLEDHPTNREFAARHPGAEYIYFPSTGPTAERRFKRRLMDGRNDDVVVTCGISVRNLLSTRRRTAAIQVLDHPEITSSFENRRRARRAFEYGVEWWAMFAYDGHLAVSRYLENRLRRRLRRFGKPERVLYSPFAAEDDIRDPDAAGTAAVAARYHGKILLYVGSFFRDYGFYEMLEAAETLAKERRDFTLVLAGAGAELEAGQRFVAERNLGDVVSFPGFLTGNELRDYLYASHAFISPMNDTMRDWARSPGKIYMYAATGRPIVTSRVGEAIDTLGDDGFYYEQGSVASMAEQLRLALESGSNTHPGSCRENLFWGNRTDRFLEWLQADFGLPAG